MYVAYKYSPSNYYYNQYFNKYLSDGQSIYDDHQKHVRECLSDYISTDGVINGSELRENWFSIETTDIFISHSHKDINKVKAFAGWLYNKFRLTSFVDSCAWGYCDDLLNIIDKKYCYKKEKGTYNYNLRNYTTAHVHMMLATAIVETMNRSECVIFFNTPNSIVMSDQLSFINSKDYEKTTSPWIFYELTMISKMNRVKPIRKTSVLSHTDYKKRDNLNIQYDVSDIIETIPIIDDNRLIRWSDHHNKCCHPLDELYSIMGS